jgi:S1-C subfamily serine protease
MSELRAELAKHSASESVQITLIREPLPGISEEHTLTVTLTEDPN